MKLAVVNHVSTKFTVYIPDSEKADVFKPVEFVGKFKCLPQNKNSEEKIRELLEESGLYGFLETVLLDVEPTTEFTVVDENGNPLSLVEGFKQNTILAKAVFNTYLELLNKGTKGKNSKR